MNDDRSYSTQLGNSLVRVYFRIFPVKHPKFDIVKLKRNSKVYVKKTISLRPDSNYWEFETDGVFNNCKQEYVYTEVVGDILEKLEHGQNAAIVSFGKTGTGKSVTIAGLEMTEEDYGLAPRIIKGLLRIKKSLQKHKRMCIKMSYAEFSRNEVFDLFKDYPNQMEDHWKLPQKLVRVKVRTELEALEQLYAGEGRRETKKVKNYLSHMNSSVLTFYVTTKDVECSNQGQITGKIHLVDMAGLDTPGSLSAIFKTKWKVGDANLNKSYMEQFFIALCQCSNEMINFKSRSNPFIFFLGQDIKKQSLLRFIGHITTLKNDCSLTTSMLKFGQIVKGYTPTVVNLEYEISPEHKLKFLQNKVDELERERIQNSVLLNQDLSLNLNCERVKHLNKTIKEYLQNEITEIEVMSVADATTIFKMFKDMLEQTEIEKKALKDTVIKKDSDSSLVTKKKTLKENNLTKRKRSSATNLSEKLDKQNSAHILPPVEEDVPKQVRSSRSHDVASSVSVSSLSKSGVKKIKSKLAAIPRPSLRVRRSLLSTFSNEQMLDQGFLPDNIPENLEAWNDYAKNSQYNLIVEQYRENEKNILETYMEYLNEIKQLQAYKHETEAMKQELLEARILLKYKEKSEDVDEQTETILNEAEFLCRERMGRAEHSTMKQQEIVLRCLAELKIFMNNRRDLRRKLNDDFDNYCKTKFLMPMPQVKSLSDMEMMKESKKTLEEECQEESFERDKGDILEQKRNQQRVHLNNIMWQEKKKLDRIKYCCKPYKLVPLPDHRDAPTVYKKD